MNADFLAPLRKLPVKVRKYYYGVATSALPLVVGAAIAFGFDPGEAAAWSASVAGFLAALLAFSNTGTSEPEVPEIVEKVDFVGEPDDDGYAQPAVRVKLNDGRTFEGVWQPEETL